MIGFIMKRAFYSMYKHYARIVQSQYMGSNNSRHALGEAHIPPCGPN
jgi:hypothetical protein